jgi:DNA-directed RNA polymerase subunit RPC12/RpoP
MPDQITNYQCPACGGPLHFSNATQDLACDYCGSHFPGAQIEAL